jgi:tight adherence protein B
VQFKAGRRVAALEAQIPDALDMASAALQAGAGLAQSFGVIAREMPPPISDEMRRVLREVEIGLSMNEALSNLTERLGSDDLDLVVTTINVQTRVGGNLVNILRTITTTIRERIRIRGEVKVLTSMQRMSAIVISGVPPGLGLILWRLNPTYVGRLFQPGIGEVLLILAVTMEVAGFIVLRKLTDVEV